MKYSKFYLIICLMLIGTMPSIAQTLKERFSYADVNGYITEWAKRDFHTCFERKFKNVEILLVEFVDKYSIKVTGKVRYTYLRIPADREFSAIVTSTKVTFTKECSTCSDGTKTCTAATSKNNFSGSENIKLV